MKKLFFLPFFLICTVGFAQSRFVLQNETTKIFSNINDAITAANAGDTLYIPGGGFAITNTTIDKTLHWVGTGHYPDSTVVTGQSRITSPLTFTGNCDNSTFEGIYFTGNVTFGSVNNDALNIILKRCRVGGTLYLRGYETDTMDINFHITESVLSNIDARYAANCLVEKSIINRYVAKFYMSFFQFNNFNLYDYYNRAIQRSNSCLFKNNIFSYNFGLYLTESCEFSYNLFAGALPFDPVSSTMSGNNNVINVDRNTIYNTISGNFYDFKYTDDYHLKVGCAAIGAAEDGTDMGIYGSALPYKEGAVPFYPHIMTLDIDNEAVNGKLGVKISVAAQER